MASYLYRHRGVIGGMAFVVLLCFASPSASSLLNSLILIIPGLALRFAARGYIGKDSDRKEMAIDVVIDKGVYKLRHPLYLGNFLLTLGVLCAQKIPPFLFWATLFLFLVEYSAFVIAEEKIRRSKGREWRGGWSWAKARRELRTLLLLTCGYLVMAMLSVAKHPY